jgi:hypothetical protein
MSIFDYVLGSQGSQGPNSMSDPGAMSVADMQDNMTRFGGSGMSPMAPAGASAGGMGGLGFNVGTGQLALGGLGALTSIWGGLQANSLAKKQFKFTKNVTNTNLANQIKSYNTALDDRITSRAKTQGMSEGEVAAYRDRNSLSR